MFFKNTNIYLESCYEELMNSENKTIQKCLKEAKKYIPEEEYPIVFQHLLRMNLSHLLIENISENDFDNAFSMMLKDFIKSIKSTHQSLVISIKLKYLEDEINRIIEIPYNCTLADLAYYILAVFEAEASHLFYIEYKKEKYVSNADVPHMEWEEEIAEDHRLVELNIKKNSKLYMCYDYGDNYEFDIKVLELKNHDSSFTEDDAYVIEGNGYGIWEDEHYLLNLYYGDKEKFYEYLDNNGFEAEWYPIDEEFDLDETNELLLGNYKTIKDAYELEDDIPF